MTDAPVLSGDHVRVVLERIEVLVACGLHAWERHPERPNRLWVDVEMFAAWSAGGDGYVDYDRVRRHVLGWQGQPHVDLLETLLKDLTDFIFLDEAVQACRVRIAKPDIFPETRAAGVELFRRRPA